MKRALRRIKSKIRPTKTDEDADLALARRLQEEEQARDKAMREAAKEEGIEDGPTLPSHWLKPGEKRPPPHHIHRGGGAHMGYGGAPGAGGPEPTAPPASRMYPSVGRPAPMAPYVPAVVQDTSNDEEIARRMAVEEQARETAMREAATVFCPVCRTKVPMDEALTLRCDHRGCQDCLALYITSKINDRAVREDQLVCPYDGCRAPLSVHEVKGNVSAEVYAKYQRFSTEVLLEDDPNTVLCPLCQVYAEYPVLEANPKVKCLHCKAKFCARCREPGHHDGTCAEFLQWKRENGMVEEALEKLIAEKKWQRCPKCNLPCSLDTGCFFMTCKCRTNFCYLCGDTLTPAEHFKGHFPKGAFAAPCVKTQKPGEGAPPAGGPAAGAGGAAGPP